MLFVKNGGVLYYTNFMDMTDQEFDQLLVTLKRYSMRVLRPVSLAIVVYVLSSAQGYFAYPVFTLVLVVFVLSLSNYGAPAAYSIIFFLTLLVLLPPEAMLTLQKALTSILNRSV